MAGSSSSNRVIRASDVNRVTQPVLLNCTEQSGEAEASPMAVVPIVDSGVVKGFEVRCRCGSSVVIECIYGEKP